MLQAPFERASVDEANAIGLWRPKVRIEVRRARGRGMSVTPRDGDIRCVDDGVVGPLTRKRSWWTEPGAWGIYVM